MTPVIVHGLSWAHPRGHAPMVVTGGLWTDQHPDVELEWRPRSLAEFAAGGLAEHVGRADLVALDHPLLGEAVQQGWLQPLEQLLPAAVLTELRDGTVGPSYASYQLHGHTWAAPLDAAALTSAYRPDLLDGPPPATMDELVELAGASGRVGVPLTPFGGIAIFLSWCAQLGGTLFAADRPAVVEDDVALDVLDRLAGLAMLVPPVCFDEGAAPLLRRLTRTDELHYVGYAYGYCLYARDGWTRHPLTFSAPPPLRAGTGPRPTVGGVGLAVLRDAPHPEAAAEFLAWVTSAPVQRGPFVASGGQPARREAWLDAELDRQHRGFFSRTGASLESGYLRPNASWFGPFQTAAADALREFLRGSGSARSTLDAMNGLLRATRDAR